MLPRSDRRRRVDPSCPDEMRREIEVALATGVAGQGIVAGERLGDLVMRVCPSVFEIANASGFELRLDMPENTHRALRKGKLAFQIRRKPPH